MLTVERTKVTIQETFSKQSAKCKIFNLKKALILARNNKYGKYRQQDGGELFRYLIDALNYGEAKVLKNALMDENLPFSDSEGEDPDAPRPEFKEKETFIEK